MSCHGSAPHGRIDGTGVSNSDQASVQLFVLALAGATLADLLGYASNTAQGLRFDFGGPAVILVTGATVASIQDDLLLA